MNFYYITRAKDFYNSLINIAIIPSVIIICKCLLISCYKYKGVYNNYNLNPGMNMTEDMFDDPKLSYIRRENLKIVARTLRKFSICSIDLRICKVLDVCLHPNKDDHYILTMDIGERNFRTVVTPAKPFYQRRDLISKMFVCVTNTYSEDKYGVYSGAILLYAINGSRVELLRPPVDCVTGDRVCLPHHMPRPASRLRMYKTAFKRVISKLEIINNTLYYNKLYPMEVVGKGGRITCQRISTGLVREPLQSAQFGQ